MAESIVINLDVDSEEGRRALRSFEQAAEKRGTAIGTRLTAGIAGALRQLGPLLAGAFAAIGFRELFGVLNRFETATAEIRTITQGLGIDQEKLNERLIETSQQFGTSAQQQANTFYQIISAGITDATRANEFLIQANKLAIGGLTSTAQAVNVLTTATNALESQNLKVAEAADILFTTVQLGKTTVDELASSIGIVLPLANQLGVGFDEIGAAVADLTAKGIPTTAEAVTSLRALFTGLIRGQERAAKISEELGDVFSVQALKTKGLVGFLRDLNQATAGNEQQLTKLIGRVEGVTAALTLGSDGFEGLEEKIRQTSDAAGASDQAFQKINSTLSQQTSRLFANVSGIFLRLSSNVSDTLVPALESFNERLIDLSRNIDGLIDSLVVAARRVVIFAAIVKRQAIFAFLSRRVAVVTGAIRVFSAEMRVGMSSAMALGATRARAFGAALRSTTVATTALRGAVTLLKASLTIGLTLALDAIIQRLFDTNQEIEQTRRSFASLSEAGKLDRLNQQISAVEQQIKDAKSQSEGGLVSVTDQFGQPLNTTVGLLESKLQRLTEQKREIEVELGFDADNENLNKILNQTNETVTSAKKELLDKLGAIGLTEIQQLERTEQKKLEIIRTALRDGAISLQEANARTIELTRQFQVKREEMTKEEGNKLQRLNATINNAIGATVTNSIRGMSKALVEGGNAFAAFRNAALATIGQFAIQLGQAIITTALAIEALKQTIVSFLGPAGAVAAGAALIAIGQSMVSKFGGGPAAVGAAGGAGVGGGAEPEPVFEEPQLDVSEQIREQQQVVVNVEGNILDRRETGLELVEILQESFETQDAEVVTA